MNKISDSVLRQSIFLLFTVLSLNIVAQIPDDIKVVRPQEIDDVLINPV